MQGENAGAVAKATVRNTLSIGAPRSVRIRERNRHSYVGGRLTMRSIARIHFPHSEVPGNAARNSDTLELSGKHREPFACALPISRVPASTSDSRPRWALGFLGAHKVHKSVKFSIMARTAMTRSHSGTGVSPVNDGAV